MAGFVPYFGYRDSASALDLAICDWTSEGPGPHFATARVSRCRVKPPAAEVRPRAACSLAASDVGRTWVKLDAARRAADTGRAMSQENVEAFKHGLSAFNRRDLGALLELADADVEAVPLLVEMEGDYHGHAGMRRWWTNLLDVFPDFATEVVEVRDLGDLTLGTLRYRARSADTDTPVEARLWMVARWRSGKCVWWGTFGTEDEALEAVGLGE